MVICLVSVSVFHATSAPPADGSRTGPSYNVGLTISAADEETERTGNIGVPLIPFGLTEDEFDARLVDAVVAWGKTAIAAAKEDDQGNPIPGTEVGWDIERTNVFIQHFSRGN